VRALENQGSKAYAMKSSDEDSTFITADNLHHH